ncbi:MAG: DUF4437 domain-containing protein [Candidatus Thiodiazotropha sp.]
MIKSKRDMRELLPFAFATTLTTVCSSMEVAAEQTNGLVLASELKWEQLNPARGDRSPKAATLWGDRKGAVPTGFLAKFVDGFSSPPHIHNVTYRAVVISGGIHNDDPNAAAMWMPAGSFWTQPKGEVHITAARGNTNVALVEIDEGPYLVLPVEKAFDSGERPINLDASTIVWVVPPGMPASSNGPKIAYLWGSQQEGQANGTFVKLPTGFRGKIRSTGSTFRAVVIKGQPEYQVSETEVKTLEPGSYFGSVGTPIHNVSSMGGEESVLYIRTNGNYEVKPN